jgi:hypothetical protein
MDALVGSSDQASLSTASWYRGWVAVIRSGGEIVSKKDCHNRDFVDR